MQMKSMSALATIFVILGGYPPARAAEVPIDTATTTPVNTSTIDGGAPGDIRVTVDGSIDITGGVAVTLDSSNSVFNEGTITGDDVANLTAVQILGGNSGLFENSGAIRLPQDDGAVWISGKTNIHVTGPGAFTGDISNLATGSITARGDNGFGILVETNIIGDILNEGTINLAGENNTGILIGSNITGAVRNDGGISNSIAVYDADNDPDTVDLFSTGPAVAIGGSISAGFYNHGPVAGDADDTTARASISTFGGSETVLISPLVTFGGAQDITIGAVADPDAPHSFVNRGDISATAQQGVSTTAVRISGLDNGTQYRVTLTGGFYNSGSITANSEFGSSSGMTIGELVDLPMLVNKGQIAANGSADPNTIGSTADVVALSLSTDPGSVVLTNTGEILASLSGDGSVVAVHDQTGAISTLTNEGTIGAAWADTSTTDNPISPVAAIAIDASGSSLGMTLINREASGSDDLTGQILGEIHFGSGNDRLTFESGAINSDISFGLGDDTFEITNGGSYIGDISDVNGTLDLQVMNGNFDQRTIGAVDVGSLTLGSGADIGVMIDVAGAINTMFNVAGVATLQDGASFSVDINGLIDTPQSYTLIDAGSLVWSGTPGSITLADVPFIYSASVTSLGGELSLNLAPKTVNELELPVYAQAAYLPMYAAASANQTLSDALTSLTSGVEFYPAFQRFLPDETNARFVGHRAGVNAFSDAIIQNSRDIDGRDASCSVWAREIFTTTDVTESPTSRGADASGFTLAGGYNMCSKTALRLGLAFSMGGIDTDVAGGTPGSDGNTMNRIAVHTGFSAGDFSLDFIGSAGMGEAKSERSLVIGNDIFSGDGDWNVTEFGGRAEARYSVIFGYIRVEPIVSATYTSLTEDSYIETGDLGFALEATELETDSLEIFAGADFGIRAGSPKNAVMVDLKLGYAQEMNTDAVTRSYRYAGTTDWFDVVSPELDSGRAVAGITVSGLSPYGGLYFTYQGRFGDAVNDHYAGAAFKVRF